MKTGRPYRKTSPRPTRSRAFISFITVASLALGLTGCRSIVVQRNSTAAQYPAHTNKVFMTELSLPDTATYASIGKVTVQSDLCPTETLLLLMAKRARALGATAIVDLSVSHRSDPPGMWFGGSSGRVRASQIRASGSLIHLSDTNVFAGLPGYWY